MQMVSRSTYLNPRDPEAVQHLLCVPCQPVWGPMHNLATLLRRSLRPIEYKDREERKTEQAGTASEECRELRVFGVTMA